MLTPSCQSQPLIASSVTASLLQNATCQKLAIPCLCVHVSRRGSHQPVSYSGLFGPPVPTLPVVCLSLSIPFPPPPTSINPSISSHITNSLRACLVVYYTANGHQAIPLPLPSPPPFTSLSQLFLWCVFSAPLNKQNKKSPSSDPASFPNNWLVHLGMQQYLTDVGRAIKDSCFVISCVECMHGSHCWDI